MKTQETGNPETQTAEKSEVATATSSVECASAHVVVYPNSGSVNPTIIIGNNNRQFPVINSDAAEEPGSCERASQSATVTTDVAGAEQTTRTGRRYNQISSSRMETEVSEFEVTSRKCCTVFPLSCAAARPRSSLESAAQQFLIAAHQV